MNLIRLARHSACDVIELHEVQSWGYITHERHQKERDLEDGMLEEV